MLCKGHSPYSYRCICVRSVCSMASNTSQDTTERVVHFRKRKRGSRDVVGEPISANLAGNSPPLSHPLAVRQLQDTLVLQRARQKEHGVRAMWKTRQFTASRRCSLRSVWLFCGSSMNYNVHNWLVPSLENSLRIPTACTAVVAPPPLKITSKLLTL
uniref:FH1/FH2 domain-containing protein 3 n=1 Tax=Lygus hesperus TaxID=30085 RepID=A0A0A9VSF9_LYGHE